LIVTRLVPFFGLASARDCPKGIFSQLRRRPYFDDDQIIETKMPKALESLVELYVKLKDHKALEKLLDGRQITYSKFERLDFSKKILDEVAGEIEIIKAGLVGIAAADDPAEKTQSGEVKVTGIVIAASPAEASVDSPPQVVKGKSAAPSVVVTGLSISVGPSQAVTDDASLLPPNQIPKET
jgi:hypothetical protein